MAAVIGALWIWMLAHPFLSLLFAVSLAALGVALWRKFNWAHDIASTDTPTAPSPVIIKDI